MNLPDSTPPADILNWSVLALKRPVLLSFIPKATAPAEPFVKIFRPSELVLNISAPPTETLNSFVVLLNIPVSESAANDIEGVDTEPSGK